MKEEELERLQKGRDLWIDIMSRENVLSAIEEALQRKDEIKSGTLHINPGFIEPYIILDAEAVIHALEIMKTWHEETIKEWKRQFEAL